MLIELFIAVKILFLFLKRNEFPTQCKSCVMYNITRHHPTLHTPWSCVRGHFTVTLETVPLLYTIPSIHAGICTAAITGTLIQKKHHRIHIVAISALQYMNKD